MMNPRSFAFLPSSATSMPLLFAMHVSDFERKPSGAKNSNPCRAHPVVDHRVVLRVPRVARSTPSVKMSSSFDSQRVDVRDARRARRHVLGLVLRELHEVEIVAATLHRRRLVHRLLARGEKREPRRHRERLLRAGEQHIDAQFVHRHRHHAERRHRVHDQAHVRETPASPPRSPRCSTSRPSRSRCG